MPARLSVDQQEFVSVGGRSDVLKRLQLITDFRRLSRPFRFGVHRQATAKGSTTETTHPQSTRKPAALQRGRTVRAERLERSTHGLKVCAFARSVRSSRDGRKVDAIGTARINSGAHSARALQLASRSELTTHGRNFRGSTPARPSFMAKGPVQRRSSIRAAQKRRRSWHKSINLPS